MIKLKHYVNRLKLFERPKTVIRDILIVWDEMVYTVRSAIRGFYIDARDGFLNFVLGSYYLKIKSLKWGWCDKDEVLLQASFQILVDFVEKECSRMERALNPSWDRTATDEDLGLNYIRGSAELNSDKEKHKIQIIELYLWWKYERPTREDTWNMVTCWAPEGTPLQQVLNPPAKVKRTKAYKKYIESIRKAGDEDHRRYQEDTDKLMELVSIRSYLWT